MNDPAAAASRTASGATHASSPWSDPSSWIAHGEMIVRHVARSAEGSVKGVLHWASSHTGLPAIVVAALVVVLAWRVARRTWHVFFELAVAFALLFAATRMGWIRW